MEENTQAIGFENDGTMVIRNREYRRRKIKMAIDPKNLPKPKPRKKNNKKNYLKKRMK